MEHIEDQSTNTWSESGKKLHLTKLIASQPKTMIDSTSSINELKHWLGMMDCKWKAQNETK